MKKVLKGILIAVMFGISLFIQLFWLNNVNLFGVKPNILLISVIVVSLYSSIYSTTIYSFTVGFVVDILFGGAGLFTISYTIIGIILGFLSEVYMNENFISSIILTIISVGIFEVIEYFCTMISISSYISIFLLIKYLILSILLNLVLVLIVNFIYGKLENLIEKKDEKIYW